MFKEIGVKNGENGFIFDFDLSNINVTDIYQKCLKFNYEPKQDHYKDILVNVPNKYKEDLKTIKKVKVIKNFFDLQLRKFWSENDEFSVNKIRAEELEEKKLVKIL